MATLRSLIVKIGADSSNIEQALKSVGESSKTLEKGLQKLGATPLGQQTQKDAERLNATLKALAEQNEKTAQTGQLAAAGIAAIGGPARLTSSQLDQINKTVQQSLEAFRALGQQAPAELQKVAAAIQQQQKALQGGAQAASVFGAAQTALLSQLSAIAGPAALGLAVKQTLDYADSLTKLADQTGIGTEALQRLEAIAKPSGNTLEELAQAVNKFQKNLAEGDKGALGALDRLGISFQQIKAQSPDEQFITIAKAIAQIQDPAERTRAAVELFGRSGAQILPSLIAKVDELKNSTTVMSADSVKALDDFGDALGRLKTNTERHLGETLGIIVDFAGKVQRVIDALKHGTPLTIPSLGFGANLLLPGASDLEQQARAAEAARQRALAQANQTGPAAPIPQVDLSASVLSVEQLIAVEKELGRENEELLKFNQQVEAAQKELFGSDLIQRATIYLAALGPISNISKLTVDEQKKLSDALRQAAAVYEALGQTVPENLRKVVRETDAWIDTNELLAKSVDRVGQPLIGLSLTWEQLINLSKGLTAGGNLVAKAFDGMVKPADNATKSFKESAKALDEFFANATTEVQGQSPLNTVLIQEATGAKKTKDWTADLEELAKGWSRVGSIGGESINGLVRAIGTAIAAVDVFAKSIKTLEDDSSSRFQKLGASFSLIGTGIELASTLFNLLKNIGGPNEAQTAARDQQKGLVDLLNQQVTAAERLEIANGHGSKSYLTLAIVGRDALLQIGKSAAETDRIIQGLLDTEHPERFAASLADVNKALQLQHDATNALDDALSRYNFTASEKGAALNFQAQDKLSQQLFKDFQVLTGAGVDTNAILREMGGSASQFVQQAKLFGTAVPEDMRKMLEALAASGNLLDENGNKITDLTAFGITFTQSLTAGMQEVVASVKELVDVLKRQLGIAVDDVTDKINGIPRTVTVDVNLNTTGDFPSDASPFVPGASTGGLVTPFGIQHFAQGGRVLPFASLPSLPVQHFADGGVVLPFMPRGADTVPAMLSPNEVVLNVAQQHNIGGLITALEQMALSQGGSAASFTIQLLVDGHQFGEVFVDRAAKDKRGLGTKLRRVVNR